MIMNGQIEEGNVGIMVELNTFDPPLKDASVFLMGFRVRNFNRVLQFATGNGRWST
jgi:hypothetical protein